MSIALGREDGEFRLTAAPVRKNKIFFTTEAERAQRKKH